MFLAATRPAPRNPTTGRMSRHPGRPLRRISRARTRNDSAKYPPAREKSGDLHSTMFLNDSCFSLSVNGKNSSFGPSGFTTDTASPATKPQR